MNRKNDFLKNCGYIYLAYRLFNFIDKLDALTLDKRLESAFATVYGKKLNHYPVFLPYRDTLQHSDVGAFTWESVYAQDLAQMNHAYATVALMNGPSFDDGVGFELGYSVGLGLPTVVVVNDALVYHNLSLPNSTYTIDPVVDTYVGRIISNIHLHGRIFGDGLLDGLEVDKESKKQVKSFEYTHTLAERFTQRLTELADDSYDEMEEVVKELIDRPGKFVKKLPRKGSKPGQIHVELGGGKYQWQQELAEKLVKEINAEGMIVTYSKRFVRSGDVKKDVESLAAAEVVVVCADGDNVDIGTAFLMGMAKAMGKKIVLCFTGNLIWSEPPVLPKIIRNPMITYSADKVVTDYAQIVNAIKEFYE